MSGGGGHIILSNTKATLSDPLVHGALPPKTTAIIDPILAKDPSTWSALERREIAKAYSWALNNLQ